MLRTCVEMVTVVKHLIKLHVGFLLLNKIRFRMGQTNSKQPVIF